MNLPGNLESRRRFLLLGGRSFGFAALAALVAATEIKRRRLGNNPNCVKLLTCGDCAEFHGCSQPKAEQFRNRS